MRLLEIVVPLNITKVLTVFDQIKVYKSSTQNGTYTYTGTPITLITDLNYYTYFDSVGLSTDFYRYTLYKSTITTQETEQFPANTFYATIAELKQRLNETGDDDNNVYLTVLQASTQMIDDWCNRSFRQIIETRYFTGPGPGPRYTNRYPKRLYVDDLLSTSLVKIDYSGGLDPNNLTTLTQDTHFYLWPQMAISTLEPFEALDFIAYSNFPLTNSIYFDNTQGIYWPRGPRAIRITGTWGWPIQLTSNSPVPSTVTEACLQMASRLYKGRDNAYSRTVGNAELGSLRIKNTVIDGDVKEMLQLYRKAMYYGQSKEN